jgi:hypothetical protein
MRVARSARGRIIRIGGGTGKGWEDKK